MSVQLYLITPIVVDLCQTSLSKNGLCVAYMCFVFGGVYVCVYVHVYTCAYVHEQDSTDMPVQSFGLMCHFDSAKAGAPPDEASGGTSGCALPDRLIHAQVQNFEISVYQVKK